MIIVVRCIILITSIVKVIDNQKFSEIENESYVENREEYIRQKMCLSLSQTYRWDTNIYYIVGEGINEKIVYLGLKKIEDETCFKFKRVSKVLSNTQGIIFNTSNFYGSFVGKVVRNGYQYIYLRKGSNNDISLIMHAIANTLGMYNEHMRPDRGKHIRINYENIDETSIFEFNVLNGSDTHSYEIDYDYGSLLHFGNIAFSKERKPTIETYINAYNRMIGQRVKLSFNDYKLLNLHYCSYRCKVPILCNNNGYQDPKNCMQCRCPNGYSGRNCERLTKSDKTCLGGQIVPSQTDSRTITIKGNQTCTYLIRAPIGYVIKINIKNVILPGQKTCIEGKGFEIKYRKDKGAMGLNLCGVYRNIFLKSEDNNVIIQYLGKRHIDAAVIGYKHVLAKTY
uniref:Metalloendopeptidase n=1 Tax=Strongyloides venezuelensis TaxID=75913 RepID=A0A0K0FJE7_STRVS